MTSECYVYIHLPGKAGAVTAGQYRLHIKRDSAKVGRLVEAECCCLHAGPRRRESPAVFIHTRRHSVT